MTLRPPNYPPQTAGWLREWTNRNARCRQEYDIDPLAASRRGAVGAVHLAVARGHMTDAEGATELAVIRAWTDQPRRQVNAPITFHGKALGQ